MRLHDKAGVVKFSATSDLNYKEPHLLTRCGGGGGGAKALQLRSHYTKLSNFPERKKKKKSILPVTAQWHPALGRDEMWFGADSGKQHVPGIRGDGWGPL